MWASAWVLLLTLYFLLFLLEVAESFLFRCTARALVELTPYPDLARAWPRLLFDFVPVVFEPAKRDGSLISAESSFYIFAGLSAILCLGGKWMLGSSASSISTNASVLFSFWPDDPLTKFWFCTRRALAGKLSS